MAMNPFTIDFGQDAIDDLQRRIDAVRWPAITIEEGWNAGTNDAVLRELVNYWRCEYDWFEQQDRLNALDHHRGPIGGEDLHCVRYSGSGGTAVPLLLIHGWPGSIVEFTTAAQQLSVGVDGSPGFELVVPSLPGFGFSQAPNAPGMHPGTIAERLHQLMLEFGYESYGVQGGDWGSIIGSVLAHRHPEAVRALHVNFVAGVPRRADGQMSDDEQQYWAKSQRFQATETGYSLIQGTRPQTLSYAQHDSPVGLLAWILEKFWVWSDHGDDIWDTFDRDQVLTNVMLYWLTGSVLSAARIYYETRQPAAAAVFGGRVEVPTAYARYPAEPWAAPDEVVERGYNLVRVTEPAAGGHFAALEQPGVYAADVASFFASI
jgi:pimeloyl-ACP methyl ester carboxylesterase